MAYQGTDFYLTDRLLSDEERDIRDATRQLVDEQVLGLARELCARERHGGGLREREQLHEALERRRRRLGRAAAGCQRRLRALRHPRVEPGLELRDSLRRVLGWKKPRNKHELLFGFSLMLLSCLPACC